MSKDNNLKNSIKENKVQENCDSEQKSDVVAKDWDRDPQKIRTTTQKNILRKIFKKQELK